MVPLHLVNQSLVIAESMCSTCENAVMAELDS